MIGYKNSKGKKPRRFDVWRFQELVTKDEAVSRLQAAYPFSIITDVAPRRDDTKLDELVEGIKDAWWVLLPAALIASGLVLGIRFQIVWPAIAMIWTGIFVGVAFAPRSPV